MLTKQLPTETVQSAKRSRGRQLRYGAPTTQQWVYMTHELKERIEREARSRNVRDDTNEWNFGRVAVDILLEFFDMPRPTQGTSNGR